MSLLKNRDLDLYRETAEIHSELRKVKTITANRFRSNKSIVNFQELNSIPTEISSPHQFLSSSTILASVPPSTSSKVSSQIAAKNISNSILPFNVTENMLKIMDNLCVDNCHVMFFASLLIGVIFIISVFSIIILCRRKHNYNIKSNKSKNLLSFPFSILIH